MEERAFQGIWIDACLWRDNNLSATQKFLFKEIESLDHGRGCGKKLDDLSACAGITKKRARYHIRVLIDKGYIYCAGRNGRRRYLKVAPGCRGAKYTQEKREKEAREARERLKKEKTDSQNNERALVYYHGLNPEEKAELLRKVGDQNRFIHQTLDADPRSRTSMLFITDYIIRQIFNRCT